MLVFGEPLRPIKVKDHHWGSIVCLLLDRKYPHFFDREVRADDVGQFHGRKRK